VRWTVSVLADNGTLLSATRQLTARYRIGRPAGGPAGHDRGVSEQTAEGPYFDELERGQVFATAPAVTLTEGLAAVHEAVSGGRLRLSLDHHLARAVTGTVRAAPGLVWDVAIGQSSIVTHNVVANLFYRGVVLHRLPALGDTLHTTTRIVALRQNSRRSTGLAVLRISTVDQNGDQILDFLRCAMLPLRDPGADTGWADDVSQPVAPADFGAATKGWDLDAYRAAVPGPHFADLTTGTVIEVSGGDVVSAAPELSRLTTNIARIHHDATITGRRLVFGGHTIGLALHQAVRALPGMVTVVGWHGCDHTGPVYEGDTLRSTVEIERLEPQASGGLAHLRSRVRHGDTDVLDWRFVALFA
jgi:acyl dehydratase